MKRLLLLVAMIYPIGALAQVNAVNGYCTLGASQAVISGVQSTNYLQGIIPTCTVTVYLTGTTTLATIYSNSSSTVLANPFRAGFNGQWLFYAAPGTGLDIVLSGGNYPNFYPIPVKINDVLPGGGGGGSGGTVTSVALTAPSYFTITGSPITAAGTIVITGTSQSANLFLASPNGSSGVLSPRAIVPADMPTLNQNTTGTAANLSGTPALPNGTTATTQTVGDNTTRLATDAFVLANAGVTVVTGTGPIVSSGGATPAISCPTCGVTGTGLQQFASTTSAQLAGIISDETGSGSLVFGTGPTITLPNATGLPLTTGVTGNLPNGNLAIQTANTVLGALTATTPSGLAMPSCSGPTNALTWTSGTGFGCNTISSGGVSSFAAPSGSWPSWLVPTVTNPTTAPSLAVAAGAIPDSALLNPYPLVDIQQYFPTAINVGAMMVACHADANVLPGYTCDATRAVQKASAVGTAWSIAGGNISITMPNHVPIGEQVHIVFATTTALNGDYTTGAGTTTSAVVVPTASGLTSGTETVTMYPLKNTVDEVARSYNQNEKWPSSGTLYDQTPSTTLATPSAPGLSFAATGGSFPASQNVCATVNYRSGDGVSVRSAETCITTTAGSAGVLTITGPGSCPTYAQGWDANLTLSTVGTLDETLQGNGICGSTVAFTRAILYPSQPAMPTVATGVPAFIIYNVNHPLFYADNGANGGFVIKTGPSFNASNIIATGTKGYSTLANISSYNFSHINMTGCSVFDSAFFVGSVRQGLGAVGTGGTVGNPSCAYKIYGTANDVTFYGMSLNVQDTFGTGLQVQRTPETYGDTEGMGRIGFNSLIVTGTTSTLPLVTLAGIPCGGSTTVNCFGASDFTFIQPSFETTAASSCMTMTDVAGVTLKNAHCQGSGTSFAGATPAYIFTSTAGTSAQYQSSNLDIENPNTVGYATIYQNGINGVNVTVPNNNFAYTGDYHYVGSKFPTDVWQSRPVTSDSTLVLSAANALTLSAMTGTSCLQEVSGVVTATGSACATGSSVWSALTNPTTTLALSMGNANTTTFTYGTATSTNFGMKWTDGPSNTGTGPIGWFTTATGSAAIPWQVDANGIGFQVTNAGTLKSVGGTATGSIQLGTDGSGAGTLQLANGSAAAHTIWASAATTSNTIAGFTVVPTTGHVVTCTVSGTTCTLTDGGAPGTGTVSSVGWTGGIVSVATATTTPAFTIAGTSGGIPYFSSASTWASSAALTANSLVLGGGAGSSPLTAAGFTTDGTSVLTLGAAGTSVGSLALKNATSGTLTLSPATGALGTVTATLPANTGTIAELNLAQTFSALQTFGANASIASTAHGVLLSEGASAVVATSAGTATQCFISNGPSADPTFQSCPGGSLIGSTNQTGFFSATNTFTATSALTVNSTGTTGQVGINNLTPLAALDVLGNEQHLGIGPGSNPTTNGTCSNVATSCVLTSTTGLPTAGYGAFFNGQFAGEVFSWSGLSSGTTLTGMTRSLCGTVAPASRNTGATMQLISVLDTDTITGVCKRADLWNGANLHWPSSNEWSASGTFGPNSEIFQSPITAHGGITADSAYTGTSSMQSATYATATNCAAVGTSASPSLVACAAAAAGAFSCATTASAATCTIADTAVTANSEIFIQEVASEGTRLAVTCNTAPTVTPAVLLATKTGGTGFTINMPTITVNPACFVYHIVN